MEKILISACLMGMPVRYDGNHRLLEDAILTRWREEGRLVPFCPETAGGLPVPRAPAEIGGGAGGSDVIAHNATVIDIHGRDYTSEFLKGASLTLTLAKQLKIRLAVLKENSPSCGVGHIYDGTFSGQRLNKQGVAAALLKRHGIQVFSETQLSEAEAFIRKHSIG